MFRRRRSGQIIAEHGRLGFLESEDIDSTYVSPTLSVSSVLVADMDNKSMCLPILLETEDGKKVETQAVRATVGSGVGASRKYNIYPEVAT